MLITTLICMSSGCSKAHDTTEKNDNSKTNKNILIVYLSRTKNTKAVAEMIHNNVGGS